VNNDLLRDRLLAEEPLNENRRVQLQKEIEQMSEGPLTAKQRAWWIFSLAASVIFSIWGACILVLAPMDGYLMGVWGLYTAANVALAVYAIGVLRTGVFRLRKFMRFIAVVSPGGSLACAVLLIARSISSPTIVSLIWAVFGVLCVMVALAWILHGRIVQAELATREQLLRLELQILNLREK
jgi:hypothetical protein